jgi:hypothetical protein
VPLPLSNIYTLLLNEVSAYIVNVSEGFSPSVPKVVLPSTIRLFDNNVSPLTSKPLSTFKTAPSIFKPLLKVEAPP